MPINLVCLHSPDMNKYMLENYKIAHPVTARFFFFFCNGDSRVNVWKLCYNRHINKKQLI